MLGLLSEGRLDAAAVPSTVNLSERAEALGLRSGSTLGWETIWLSFGDDVEAPEAAALLRALDVGSMEERLIRGDGRRSQARGPTGGTLPVGELTVTAPVGDELLELLLRAVYAQLDDAGLVVEAAPIDPFVFYGPWLQNDPSDVAIRRSGGSPGGPAPIPGERVRHTLFEVATFVLWGDGIAGPQPNPTYEGPLWNLEQWTEGP
jgi:hypothetical protein